MSELLDGLMEQLGEGGVTQIANALGLDKSQAGSAIQMGSGAILGGMERNAKQPQGAAELSSALDDHNDSVFGNISDLVGGGGDGSAILGHVLGGKEAPVEQQLAGQTGLDLSAIKKLLPMLAPLVMGYLSKQKQSAGLDAGGLGSMLSNERKKEEAANPGLGGLASILDADGDGSVMDDVMDMAGGAMGGGSGSKSGLGGLLGKILGR